MTTYAGILHKSFLGDLWSPNYGPCFTCQLCVLARAAPCPHWVILKGPRTRLDSTAKFSSGPVLA